MTGIELLLLIIVGSFLFGFFGTMGVMSVVQLFEWSHEYAKRKGWITVKRRVY